MYRPSMATSTVRMAAAIAMRLSVTGFILVPAVLLYCNILGKFFGFVPRSAHTRIDRARNTHSQRGGNASLYPIANQIEKGIEEDIGQGTRRTFNIWTQDRRLHSNRREGTQCSHD